MAWYRDLVFHPQNRMHQLVVEVAAFFRGPARKSQKVIEYLDSPVDPPARTSNHVIEYLDSPINPLAITSQHVIEILQAIPKKGDYVDTASDWDFAC